MEAPPVRPSARFLSNNAPCLLFLPGTSVSRFANDPVPKASRIPILFFLVNSLSPPGKIVVGRWSTGAEDGPGAVSKHIVSEFLRPVQARPPDWLTLFLLTTASGPLFPCQQARTRATIRYAFLTAPYRAPGSVLRGAAPSGDRPPGGNRPDKMESRTHQGMA